MTDWKNLEYLNGKVADIDREMQRLDQITSALAARRRELCADIYRINHPGVAGVDHEARYGEKYMRALKVSDRC